MSAPKALWPAVTRDVTSRANPPVAASTAASLPRPVGDVGMKAEDLVADRLAASGVDVALAEDRRWFAAEFWACGSNEGTKLAPWMTGRLTAGSDAPRVCNTGVIARTTLRRACSTRTPTCQGRTITSWLRRACRARQDPTRLMARPRSVGLLRVRVCLPPMQAEGLMVMALRRRPSPEQVVRKVGAVRSDAGRGLTSPICAASCSFRRRRTTGGVISSAG